MVLLEDWHTTKPALWVNSTPQDLYRKTSDLSLLSGLQFFQKMQTKYVFKGLGVFRNLTCSWMTRENGIASSWAPVTLAAEQSPLCTASPGSHPTMDLCQGKPSAQPHTLLSCWEITQSHPSAPVCPHQRCSRAMFPPDPSMSVQPGAAQRLLAMCYHLPPLSDDF